MSGISALYFLDGRTADPPDIERMVGSMAHRGPDGEVCWCEGPVGLGHLALRSMSEMVRQEYPVRLPTGELALTADCRLDNRNSLIKELEEISRSPTRIPDGKLILSAYEKWGEECPERLLGDFAFAIWDKTRRKLFCARDHMGVKPFYYYYSENMFLCASEIKALLTFADVPQILNEERVADYLAMFFEDKSATFYKNIFRLSPGHCLTVDEQGIRCRPYWKPDRHSEVVFSSDSEYAAAFREVFSLAVEARLRTHETPAFLLSGGLDSSSMVCVARDLLKERDAPLQTFSATFPDFPQIEERDYIDAVVNSGGINSCCVRVDHLSPLRDYETVFHHEDEPFHAPNLFIYWRLAKIVSKRGLRVLLDGVDGDTTISHGLEYLEDLIRKRHWKTLMHEVTMLGRRFRQPRRRLLWHFGLKPVVTDWLGRGDADLKPPAILNPEFIRRLGWQDRIRLLLGSRVKPARGWREVHYRNVTSGLLPFYLEVNDKAAAAFGIDHRHPYYDKRLVEFCLALPPSQILKDGWDRAIQRRAMQGLVPETVRCRIKKSHWGENFKRGFFELEKDRIEETLSTRSDLLAPFVDLQALREAYGRCREGKVDQTEGMSIWVAVTLAMWLQETDIQTE